MRRRYAAAVLAVATGVAIATPAPTGSWTEGLVTGSSSASGLVALPPPNAGRSMVSGAAASAQAPDWSGGRAVAHRAGAKRIKSGRAVASAPDAEIYSVGTGAWEPTLGIQEDGEVFYAAFSFSNQVDVVRSHDDGKTWDVVSPQVGPQRAHVSLDPYVHVDRDTGRVFTMDLYLACSMLSFSDDRGETWTTNPVACGRPVNDHQTLFSGRPATSSPVLYENVLYYCWNDILTSSCSKSLDGGISWIPTGSPAFTPTPGGGQGPAGGCGGLHGHGVADRKGTIYLPREFCGETWIAISRDEGATWERVQVGDNGVANDEVFGGTGDPSVAVDAKGNLYYAWVAADRLPYLSTSTDGGKTWSRPLMIGAPGIEEAALVTVDAGAPGKIAFAYMGTTDVPGADYTNVLWNGYIGMTTDALSRDPVIFTGSANDPRYPLKAGRCGQRRCDQIGDFLDVEIAPDGTPWAALVNACVPTGCAGRSAPEGLATSGVVGRLVGGPRLE